MITPASTVHSERMATLFVVFAAQLVSREAKTGLHRACPPTNVCVCPVAHECRRDSARMLKGFREFIARGNVIDLSVAVVIGAAFTALVTKFTDSLIQPLISRIGAGEDSDYGILRINIGRRSNHRSERLLSAAINFILVAAVVYFLVVPPVQQAAKEGRRSSRPRTPS